MVDNNFLVISFEDLHPIFLESLLPSFFVVIYSIN